MSPLSLICSLNVHVFHMSFPALCRPLSPYIFTIYTVSKNDTVLVAITLTYINRF